MEGEYVKENISGGDVAYIADLDGLGRLINLICADVDQYSPGDWLLAYINADWINAPIFDKSICWTYDSKGVNGPWITRKSIRAAKNSDAQIVVSNSMFLTYRLNEANKRRGTSQIFSKCGVGFIAKGNCGTAIYSQVFVDMDGTTPVFVTIKDDATFVNYGASIAG